VLLAVWAKAGAIAFETVGTAAATVKVNNSPEILIGIFL
jgi:hypothetical protein